MNASVDDRGSKGDCTPLMEASSGGYIDIVKLLLEHTADVNSQSQAGNTALIYACCGGYEDVVEVLLNHGADIEAHNENGHTPLMEAASGGHVNVAKMLLERGACINSHSNEFKESALTLACYKGIKVISFGKIFTICHSDSCAVFPQSVIHLSKYNYSYCYTQFMHPIAIAVNTIQVTDKK